MTPAEKPSGSATLLRLAEALVAGRGAGHVEGFTPADNPFDPMSQSPEHLAWMRGFWVGRSLDEHVTIRPRASRR